MAETIVASVSEVVPLIVRGAGAALAALAGVTIELNGIHRIAGDPTLIAFWVAWIGVLVLYAGYVLASDLSVRLRSEGASATGE